MNGLTGRLWALDHGLLRCRVLFFGNYKVGIRTLGKGEVRSKGNRVNLAGLSIFLTSVKNVIDDTSFKPCQFEERFAVVKVSLATFLRSLSVMAAKQFTS